MPSVLHALSSPSAARCTLGRKKEGGVLPSAYVHVLHEFLRLCQPIFSEMEHKTLLLRSRVAHVYAAQRVGPSLLPIAMHVELGGCRNEASRIQLAHCTCSSVLLASRTVQDQNGLVIIYIGQHGLCTAGTVPVEYCFHGCSAAREFQYIIRSPAIMRKNA